MWAIKLPEGAYNLSNWGDVLVFRKRITAERRYVDILYAQRAGEDSPAWEFKLPDDVPDVEFRSSDVIETGARSTTRLMQYFVGERAIFIYGNGTIFALEPNTGKTLWRSAVSDDPVIKKVKNRSVRFDYADMQEVSDDLLLFSDRVLARFSKTSRRVTALVRTDLSSFMF